MKTSFYFVLWIGIYLLIGLFGGQTAYEYSFIIALIAVFALSGIINKLFHNEIVNELTYQNARMFEMLYTNDHVLQLKQARKRLLFDLGTAIYMGICTFVMLFVMFSAHVNEWFALVIFALLTYWYIKRSMTDYRWYAEVRQSKSVVIPDDPNFREAYQQYCTARATHPYTEMYPQATTRDKIYRGANMLFSVICVIIGVAFIGLSGLDILTGNFSPVNFMDIAYGSLAFAFGINDFITSA